MQTQKFLKSSLDINYYLLDQKQFKIILKVKDEKDILSLY